MAQNQQPVEEQAFPNQPTLIYKSLEYRIEVRVAHMSNLNNLAPIVYLKFNFVRGDETADLDSASCMLNNEEVVVETTLEGLQELEATIAHALQVRKSGDVKKQLLQLSGKRHYSNRN